MKSHTRIAGIAFVILLAAFIWAFADETLTISTYYPSPNGAYRELNAYRAKIGTTYSNASTTVADNNVLVQGSVGIGLTSPLSPLHVHGTQLASFTGTTRGLLTLNGAYVAGRYTPIDFLYADNANPTARIAAYHDGTGSQLVFGTSNSYASGITNSAMIIDNVGQVGIGGMNPAVTLHARSNASTSPLLLESTSTNDTFSILPWTGVTYLGCGVYYKNGAWVHDASGTDNCLLALSPSGGATWYDSNNSAGSWNVASGVLLWNRSGVLSAPSSRKLKENFTPVDGEEVLAKLDGLAITRWNFKSEGKGVTHIGPVAEDFYAFFKTGDSEERLNVIDPPGVALAAVKALYKRSKKQQEQLDAQERTIDELRALVGAQSERIKALETLLGKKAETKG